MLKSFNYLKIIWALFFLLAGLILVNSHFTSTSNDSKYYTELVVRYHDQSWSNIITPKWGENFWGFDPASYNLDLFPGHLMMGVIVSKLGIPPEQSLHLLGMLFQVLSIFLLVEIAKQFISEEIASVLYYSILLTPMAFSYNLRANHELGIMFFSFLAILSGLKLTSSKIWIFTSIIASVMLLWIKGPFFIFGIMLTSLGYFFSTNRKKYYLRFLSTIFLSILFIVISAYLFDKLFFKLTGVHFILGFWKIQIESRQLPYTSKYSFLTLKLYNFYYYFWHYLVYALPWSLILFLNFFKNKMRLDKFIKSHFSLCFLLSAFCFLLVFSVNSRHAARYVFPAYYLFSAWVILVLIHTSEVFQKLHQSVQKIGVHIITPILWFVLFCLHFVQF